MAENDVEKFLAEEKSIEDRRKQLIETLLQKREAQNKEIDEQLAQLGYHGDHGKHKRNHHKKAAVAPPAPTTPHAKAKEK
jgi:hypothetical protein